MTVDAGPGTLLTRDEWLARRAMHGARVDALLAGHLARRRTGVAHPVEDFLFGKVKITNVLPCQGFDQQQWPGQGSTYRTWSHA